MPESTKVEAKSVKKVKNEKDEEKNELVSFNLLFCPVILMVIKWI